MTNDGNAVTQTTENAAKALRESDAALQGRERELAAELTTVKAQRKAVTKALETLTGTKAPRRRGRPRTTTA